MNKLPKSENFYNKFHKHGSVQTKFISKNNFTYRNIIEIFHSITKNREPLNILDFGCGVGTISFYLASLGNKVIGVDISEKAVKLAKESSKLLMLQNKITFYNLDEWTKKINKPKFDIVICIEVIEHVLSDKNLLKSIRNNLKGSGVLILSTPSINAPIYKLGLATSFDRRVGHLRRYNTERLRVLMSSSGFEITHVIKSEGIIRNSLFMFPKIGWLLRFVKGYISDLITFIDNITVSLFGESDIFIIAKPK